MMEQVTFASRQLNTAIYKVWHFDSVSARGIGMAAHSIHRSHPVLRVGQGDVNSIALSGFNTQRPQ